MTQAAILVDDLARKGVKLWSQPDGRLGFEAPGGLIPADREALLAHKPAVLALLKERQARLLADVVKVKLRDLTRIIEIAVDWCDIPILIAPGCRVAKDLRAADPKPGRVWCVCEVLDLLLTSVPPEDAQRIGQAKLALDGAVVGARRLAAPWMLPTLDKSDCSVCGRDSCEGHAKRGDSHG